jgi:hypothetical protein
MIYTVFKIAKHGTNLLLLIKTGDEFALSVYNERTGNTLMRPAESNLANLERAVAILKETASGEF